MMEPVFGRGLLTVPGKIYLNVKQKYVYIKYLFSCKIYLFFSKFSE